MEETNDAEYFIARAEQCLRLAEANRQAAIELETMGNGFMAKAVEVDTRQQKARSNPRTSRS